MIEEKEKLSREYCEKEIPTLTHIHYQVSVGFQAGWDAACDYLCKLPFDEMLNQLKTHIEKNETH